jgi:hypothetical protein
MVCVDLIKQNMTVIEAERNLPELILTAKTKRELYHYEDLKDALDNLDEEILKTYLDVN